MTFFPPFINTLIGDARINPYYLTPEENNMRNSYYSPPLTGGG